MKVFSINMKVFSDRMGSYNMRRIHPREYTNILIEKSVAPTTRSVHVTVQRERVRTRNHFILSHLEGRRRTPHPQATSPLAASPSATMALPAYSPPLSHRRHEGCGVGPGHRRHPHRRPHYQRLRGGAGGIDPPRHRGRGRRRSRCPSCRLVPCL